MNFFDRTYQYWNGLPTWAKGILGVGGAAVAVFVGKGIIDRIKSQAQILKEKQTLKSMASDLKSLEKNGVRKSFSDSYYKSVADKIEKQFSGCDWNQSLFKVNVPILGGWSGSGAMLYNVLLPLKNDADFLALQQAYDIRKYDQCGTWPFAGDFEGTLNQAVTDELDEDEIIEINKLLKSQNIHYSF